MQLPAVEEVEVAVVEYTKGRVYYCLLQDNSITYCHKPIGSISDGLFKFNITEMSFIINDKDRQEFDDQFVILKMTGQFEGKKINLHKLSLSVEEQAVKIKSYIDLR